MVKHPFVGHYVAVLILLLVASLTGERCAGQELMHVIPAASPLAFSTSEKLVAGVGRESDGLTWIAIWNVGSGEEVARRNIGPDALIGSSMFLPDGKSVALYDLGNAQMLTWEFGSDSLKVSKAPRVTRQRGRSYVCVISPDARQIAIASSSDHRSHAVRVWELDAKEWAFEKKVAGHIRDIHFAGDNEALYVLEERYNSRKKHFAAYIHKWSLKGKEKPMEQGPFPVVGIRQRGTTQGLGRIRLSPDGRLLTTTLVGDQAVVFDLATGVRKTIGPHPSSARFRQPYEFGMGSSTVLRAIAFEPNGYALATGAAGSPAIFLWPLKSTGAIVRFDQPELDSVRGLMFSPSGTMLAVTGRPKAGGVTNRFYLWRIAAPATSDQ